MQRGNRTETVIFEQKLYNDYVLSGDKLFVFGMVDSFLFMACLNILNMNVEFEETIYDFKRNLFGIGISNDNYEPFNVDLKPEGGPSPRCANRRHSAGQVAHQVQVFDDKGVPDVCRSHHPAQKQLALRAAPVGLG